MNDEEVESHFEIESKNSELREFNYIEDIKDFKNLLNKTKVNSFEYKEEENLIINSNLNVDELNLFDIWKKLINKAKRNRDKKSYKISFSGVYKGEIEKNIKGFIVFYLWNVSTPKFLFLIQDEDLKFEVDRLKEIDKFKDQTLACVTHDLRTPINGTQFFLKQAKEEIENKSEVEKYLDWSLNNLELLLALVNDILDYSQLKNQKIHLNIENFSLGSILEECKNLMEINAQFKNIGLIFENDLNIDILNDKNRIKQIIMNLISNAIKFTTNGFVKVKINMESANIAKLSVKDTGAGMNQETMEQLCKPYSTFSSNGLNKKGIGLGLFICKKLTGFIGPIENLKIESTLNEGSEFSFLFYINNIERIEQYSYSSIEEIMIDEKVSLKYFEVKPTAFTNFPINRHNRNEDLIEMQKKRELKIIFFNFLKFF